MQGIYIIKNKINELVYIGQSVNIKNRWWQHRYSAKNDSSVEHNSKLHTAMRQLGIDNFYYEVIEEISEREKLDEREIYWIDFYNSYKKGYNASLGGNPFTNSSKGSLNGRARLTEEDVIYIRTKYNEHIPFREVYEEFKEKIGKRGLQHIWHFEHWKDILPEYNTEENKLWHATKAKANPSEIARNNKRVFSNEEVIRLRKLYKDGKSIVEIWKSEHPELAKSTVRNAILGVTYKDVK